MCSFLHSKYGMALPINITLALLFILLPLPVLPAARGTVDQPPPSDAVSIETADSGGDGNIQQNSPHPSRGKRDSVAPPEDNAALQSRVQRALRECDLHFQSGKAFLANQQVGAARHEFDLAVEALMDLPDNLPDRALLERRAEEFIREIHKYDLESLGAGESPEGLIFTQSPLDGILDLTFPVDPKLKDKVLESVRASSSQLPLVVNDAVLSYINYFSSPRGQRVFMYGWKRAGRYRPMIDRVFREEGLPVELIHLAQAESGFMPRALSPKAAAGMWQFIRYTGSVYGLESSKEVDDRLDPEKATRAAARHLHDLYRKTGDWYLAMAGYNCGPLCPERAVQRTGYADFWELYRRNALPKETKNYVPAILAMAIIAKDPSAYGLPAIEQDPELSFDSVHLTAPTSLVLLADAADTPVSDLRDLNPSILKGAAPPGSDVRVPKGRGPVVLTALEVVPDSKRLSWRLHRLSSGDTLPLVARRFGIQPASILAANPALDALWFEQPREGEFVLIPTAPKPEPVRKPARTALAQRKQGTHAAVVARGGVKPTLRSSGAPRSVQLAAATRTKSRRAANR
jgi:membrane-bound lytic murein transglycosylase D